MAHPVIEHWQTQHVFVHQTKNWELIAVYVLLHQIKTVQVSKVDHYTIKSSCFQTEYLVSHAVVSKCNLETVSTSSTYMEPWLLVFCLYNDFLFKSILTNCDWSVSVLGAKCNNNNDCGRREKCEEGLCKCNSDFGFTLNGNTNECVCPPNQEEFGLPPKCLFPTTTTTTTTEAPTSKSYSFAL